MCDQDFQPNETTLAAMREAESGVELEELDLDHFDEYILREIGTLPKEYYPHLLNVRST